MRNKNLLELTNNFLDSDDEYNSIVIPTSVSNTLTYPQLQGVTQSQFIIGLDSKILHLLDSVIPHQLNITYNNTNRHNSQMAQLYNTFAAVFASYM